MSKFGFPFDVHGLCYGPDCEWQFRSCVPDVDGKELHKKFLDCKMLVSSRAT